MNDLLNYWAMCSSQFPYINPRDEHFLERYCNSSYKAPQLYINTHLDYADAQEKDFFHLSLLPVPYVGDLENADIFILRLNPGFDGEEYRIESKPKVTQELLNTLKQKELNKDYPFWYLNPEYHEHPGYCYWRDNLKDVGDYKILSQRIALLQLVPYHSSRFKESIRNKIMNELKSTFIIKSYLHQTIIPKVKEGRALLIATRGARQWDLTDNELDNIVVYKFPETRKALLNSNSRGGQKIVDWLNRS